MLMLAAAWILLAGVGGMMLLIWTDDSAPRRWVRAAHVAFGVLTLTWVLMGAHDAGVSAQGALIGLVGFSTAAGGALFRQRIREVSDRRRTLVVHVVLGGLSVVVLFWLAGG